MRAVRLALSLTLLLLCGSAQAGPSSEVAQKADEVQAEHCPKLEADRISLAARSMAAVSATWAEVDEVYRARGTSYLLYWRGVLAQCLNQDDHAREDLRAFVAAAGDVAQLQGFVQDAERRLRRFAGPSASSAASPVGTGVLGAGLAAGAAVSTAVGIWQRNQAIASGDEIHRTPHDQTALQLLISQGTTHQNTATGLFITGGALAVGSIAAFIATGALASQGGLASHARPPPTFAVLSDGQTTMFVIGGLW